MPEQTNDIIDELISAILEKKDIAEISQIISGIVDINQPGKYGKTPLLISAENGHLAVVKLLLAKGADVRKGIKKLNTRTTRGVIRRNNSGRGKIIRTISNIRNGY